MKFFMKLMQPANKVEDKELVKKGSPDEQKKKKNKAKRSSSRKEKSAAVPANISVAGGRTENEKAVENYIELMNKGASKKELLDLFVSSKAKIRFEDHPSITADIYSTEGEKLCKSFPDITFRYESIKEVEPGRVLVEDLVVSGTHSGAPYCFGPFPPVKTTNKHCVNDPERMWFTVKDGKFKEMEIIALGSVTGLAGVYAQIGGDLSAPQEH